MTMKALSLEELNEINPEKIYKLPLILNTNLWVTINLPFTMPNPVKIEFDDRIRDNMPSSVKNKKGVYIFLVEPKLPFQPDIKYLIYIGRVMKGNTFFKRFYEYVDAIGNINAKRNRQLMANAWPKKTQVYFYPMTNNKHIEFIEEELDFLKRAEKGLSKKYNFKINSHIIQFYGICEKCRKEKE